jgi:rare lipoprotein A
MKRWLIVVSLLAVCHADVAVAASQSPSLLDRILAVFHLRTTHHAAPGSTPEAAQKAESAVAKEPVAAKPEEKTASVETADAVRTAPATETARPIRLQARLDAPAPAPLEEASKPAKISPANPSPTKTSQTPQTKTAQTAKKVASEKADPIGQPAQPAKTKAAHAVEAPIPAVASLQPVAPWTVAAQSAGTGVAEKTPRAPAPRTEPKPDVAAPAVKTAAAAKAAVVAARPLQNSPPAPTVHAPETTQSVYSVASLDTRTVIASPVLKPMPAPAAQPADVTRPLSAAPPEPAAKLDQAAQVNRQGKSDRAQLVHVAILGAPNLKAVLPQETPIETPHDEPHAPSLKEESKSSCNGGRRIVTAYYWEGHHTASGQPFNPRAMTAAHRTLPFGTHLNVTNPRTGKSVEVVVNDRGPYVRGVSLDLTLGAAQAIGLRGTGSVCVL